MKIIKTTSVLLVLLMTFGVFVSCNSKISDNDSSTDSTAETNVDGRLPLSVAKEDNGGKEFRVLISSAKTVDLLDENTGNRLSATNLKLNYAVEDRLGIKITYDAQPGDWGNRVAFNERIRAQALSDTSDYDLIEAHLDISFVYAIQNGLVKDLNTLKSLKIDSPWYMKNMNENYSIKGKLYGAVSDASLTFYSEMGVIFFNQDLIKNFNFTNPYELVKNGEWYADQMFQMALAYTGETTNGDINKDYFGYVGHHVASRGYLTAFDITLASKDEEGLTYFNQAANEKFVNVHDYLYKKFQDNPKTLLVTNDGKTPAEAFKAGRAVFYNGFLADAEKFRDVEWDYGVVPMPKYDNNQDSFRTPVGTGTAVFMILENAPDAELSAKVLETKSYYSHYDTVPEYYDVILKTQYARDPVYSEMVDIIRQSAVLSFHGAYTLISTNEPFNMLQMDNRWRNEKVGASVASYYTSQVTVWNNDLKKFYTAIGNQ